MKNKLNITLEFDLNDVASLLCSGFEGGSGYWARIEEYKAPEEIVELNNFDMFEDGERVVFPHIHYPLSKGGAVIIRDTLCEIVGNDKLYTLDFEAVQRGLKLMAEEFPLHFGNWMSGNGDAITGDVFLQLATLGDIIYG